MAARRRFTAEYKLRILREADNCTKPGELGAVLRREGMYSSYLTAWRRQRDQGKLVPGTPESRGPRPAIEDPLVEENKRLRRENEQLLARLREVKMVAEVKEKVAEILKILLGIVNCET